MQQKEYSSKKGSSRVITKTCTIKKRLYYTGNINDE